MGIVKDDIHFRRPLSFVVLALNQDVEQKSKCFQSTNNGHIVQLFNETKTFSIYLYDKTVNNNEKTQNFKSVK